MSPIESAEIDDSESDLLGTPDKNGYYPIEISYNKSGEIYFRVKIVKQGFEVLVQHEH